MVGHVGTAGKPPSSEAAELLALVAEAVSLLR